MSTRPHQFRLADEVMDYGRDVITFQLTSMASELLTGLLVFNAGSDCCL